MGLSIVTSPTALLMSKLFPFLALALVLAVAGSLSGCAEAQRLVDDASRVAGAAGTSGPVVSTTAASWQTTGQSIRGQSGTFAFDCPATATIPTNSPPHGSNPYADLSSVCKAGVHAGVITARGGRVLVQPGPPQSRYAGSTRNGVRSIDSGTPGRGSYVVVTG